MMPKPSSTTVSVQRHDPRLTLYAAIHTLNSLRARVETACEDDDANELTYVIDGIAMLLEKADAEYEDQRVANSRLGGMPSDSEIPKLAKAG
jgi:hypothetical protein